VRENPATNLMNNPNENVTMVLTLRIAPSQIDSDCRVYRTAPEPPWPETPILRRPSRLFWIEGALPSTRVRWAPGRCAEPGLARANTLGAGAMMGEEKRGRAAPR